MNAVRNGSAVRKRVSYPRVVSLDFQRGFAIFLMVILHAFEHLYDYSWGIADPHKALTLPPIVLALGGVAAYLGSWNAYFLLISATVNVLAMTRRAADGARPRAILSKQLLTGFGLVVLGALVDGLLYGGYIGMAVRTGNWRDLRPLLNGVFSMYTLQVIGWSMVANGVVHVLLVRRGGHAKVQRNVLTYGCLALAVVIASPVVHRWVDGMVWRIPTSLPSEFRLGDHTTWPSTHVQAANASLRTWFLVIIAGDLEPLFPFLATSFVGSIIGLTLAKREEHRRLLAVGGPAAAGVFAVGALFALSGSFTPGNNRPALGNYLLTLGGQVGAVLLMLWLVEFRGDPARFANRRFVRAMRLWGMASLSIFSLEIVQLPLRWIIGLGAGWITGQRVNLLRHGYFGQGQEGLALLVVLCIVLYVHLLVKLWARVDFRYGFEWAIVRLAGVGSRQSSARLDVDRLMDHTEWLRCGEPAVAGVPQPGELSG